MWNILVEKWINKRWIINEMYKSRDRRYIERERQKDGDRDGDREGKRVFFYTKHCFIYTHFAYTFVNNWICALHFKRNKRKRKKKPTETIYRWDVDDWKMLRATQNVEINKTKRRRYKFWWDQRKNSFFCFSVYNMFLLIYSSQSLLFVKEFHLVLIIDCHW